MKMVSGLIICLLQFSLPVLAAELKLETYPNARVIFESRVASKEYILAIGPYKKVSGVWRLDRQQRLSGSLSRMTLELPERHTAKNGFDFYLEQLQNAGAQELFYCKGRDCGTSNSWANNHFKVMQLYGLDQFQYYGAYEITNSNEKNLYISIYAVQRGNKRVYMHADILQVDNIAQLKIEPHP